VLFSVPTPAVRTPRFRCDRCDQSYPTSEALASHKRAMHPPVRTVSGERFSSQSAHNQHRVHTRHGDEEDLPAPPVDSPGKWIPRAQFKGRKSFGHFQCPKCHKWWNSAFAFPDKKQACKECETWNHPVYLWLNSSLEPRQPRADISDTPHDGSRCEACQSGVPCTARAFSRPQR
jgi:transposase-like protein